MRAISTGGYTDGRTRVAEGAGVTIDSDYTLNDPIYGAVRNNRSPAGPSVTTGPRFVWPDVGNVLVVGVEGAGHHVLETMVAHLRNCSRVFQNSGSPGVVLGALAYDAA